MIDEVVVNRWIMKYLRANAKIYTIDEITVTEAASPCLRRPYYDRTRVTLPTPVEFLKVAGQDIHLALQDVLRAEGWEIEVSVSLKINDFTLRGRIDALKDDTIVEFKTTNKIPENGPYDSHVLQAQAYMGMIKASRGFIIYLSRSNGKVQVYKVGPDKQALRRVVDRAKQLYQSLLRKEEPPATRGAWCEYCSYKLSCLR